MTKRKAAVTHLWLAMDPETRRVTVQDHEWQDGDFPPGLRGAGWPRRELDVPAQTFTKLTKATLDADQQDRFHRDWWDQARKEGEPVWPLLASDQ